MGKSISKENNNDLILSMLANGGVSEEECKNIFKSHDSKTIKALKGLITKGFIESSGKGYVLTSKGKKAYDKFAQKKNEQNTLDHQTIEKFNAIKGSIFDCKLQVKSKKKADGSVEKFGFATPTNYQDAEQLGGDIFISGKELDDAINKDVIQVSVTEIDEKGRLAGHITDIDKSKRNSFVIGTLNYKYGEYYVIPKDNKLNITIKLPKGSVPAEVTDGETVRVKVDYESGKNSAFYNGEFVDCYKNSEFQALVSYLLEKNELRTGYSDEIIKEVETFSEPTDADIDNAVKNEGFIDERNTEQTATDSEDTGDKDDAVGTDPYKPLGYIDGVAVRDLVIDIANLTKFIKINSPSYVEAMERGNSYYLTNMILHMFHPSISTGLGSLEEGKNRYAIATHIIIDDNGKVYNSFVDDQGVKHLSRINQAIINIKKNTTYNQVQKIIDDEPIKLCEDADENQRTVDMLKVLTGISKKLAEKTRKRGSASYDLPDTKTTFTQDPVMLDKVITHYQTAANGYIEQMMVLANSFQAEVVNFVNTIDGKKDIAIPFIYRSHEAPDESALKRATKKINGYGYYCPDLTENNMADIVDGINKNVNAKNLREMLYKDMIRGTKRADYRCDNSSHNALKLKFYSHNTSGIRRACDFANQYSIVALTQYPNFWEKYNSLLEKKENKTLTLEEATEFKKDIKKYMQKYFAERGLTNIEDKYKEYAYHATETEKVSDNAERDFIQAAMCAKMQAMYKQDPNKLYTIEVVSISEHELTFKMIDPEFEGIIGTVPNMNEFEFKPDFKNNANNIFKTKITAVDPYNCLLQFEDIEKLKKKDRDMNSQKFSNAKDKAKKNKTKKFYYNDVPDDMRIL